MNPHHAPRKPVPGGVRFHPDISATRPPATVSFHP